ncbi:TPA: hypothetical protein OME36_003994 [Klebsiella michiganensis]|nr:hypothetical protein [Klebsiella michiganensis]HDX8856200.1 hypothetical protein [Klebsiella michiganensis]
MDELTKDHIKQLKDGFTEFKKSFSDDTRERYSVKSFRLTSLTLGKQQNGFLEVSFEYKGECSFVPGDCAYTEKVKVSELKSTGDFFRQLYRLISQRVNDSFNNTR